MKVNTATGIVMACRRCGQTQATFAVVSQHHTSSGVVRYVRCTCGALQMQSRSRFGGEWQSLGGQRAHATA